ncbi:hypothetical protein N8I77_002799 [Diaporthe amygdali]|uniref:Heterokaryon incompatibility domain-containing protein n=1 Tax=Phomopsis amygdali TaxID=1214568 RepID=A0AAD9STG4_PHOAM|nr:hypothetical protein N8I77_002799 [Diaporthe amygdali]
MFCRSFSVCDIGDDGFLLFEDAQDMKLAGGAGQNHSSCDLCAIIWWSLQHDWRKRPLNRGHGEFIAGDFNVRVYRNPPRGAGAIQRLDVLVMPPGSSRNFSWSPDQHGSWRIGPLDEKPWLVRSHLTVYSDTSCAESRQTSTETAFKLPEAYSGCPQSLDLVSQWLADCVKRHGSNCSDDDESVLPKHVIEIGDLVQDGTLSTRIITTNGSRGKYLTLSYCWGRGPFFTMTSDNIDELHDSLPMAKLPQTIRDAVSLAKHLGFRYLWVDSLCIIQGGDVLSTADWEEQSQDMGRIYGSSSLTIAAAAADDCHHGLFQTRPIPEIPYCPVLQNQMSDEMNRWANVAGHSKRL